MCKIQPGTCETVEAMQVVVGEKGFQVECRVDVVAFMNRNPHRKKKVFKLLSNF